ncbi:MAG TPA: SCO family protein [Chitinophagales bacterium]
MKALPFFIFSFSLLVLSSCRPESEKAIRVIGEKIILKKSANGETYFDTVAARAPHFSFTNQHNETFDSKTLNGKIWVVDFFFTHCPSICVKMKSNLLKAHKAVGANPNFEIVSFSIDPERDSVKVLYDYASKLGMADMNWMFLTGNKEMIYAVADSFLAHAAEDENSPGGFIHDGNFIVVDKSGKIRGFFDGTNDDAVKNMIEELEILLKD